MVTARRMAAVHVEVVWVFVVALVMVMVVLVATVVLEVRIVVVLVVLCWFNCVWWCGRGHRQGRAALYHCTT